MPERYIKTTKTPKQGPNLIGQQFKHLTVVKLLGRQNRKCFWECVCVCGKTTQSTTGDLRNGRRASCGCRRPKHGKSFDHIYGIWQGMIYRCHNPKNKRFTDYGGRGITVCSRWRVFANFYADMGESPSSQHSIDRIDNNKGYSPDNCRWATRSQQQRNTRDNHYVTFNGETKPLIEWAEIYQLHPAVIANRIAVGWSIKDALNMPIHSWNPARRRPLAFRERR